MDDAITRIDHRFDQIDRRFERLEDRIERGFDAVTAEFRELRGHLAASNRQLTQVGWALVGILIVQLIAAIVAFS